MLLSPEKAAQKYGVNRQGSVEAINQPLYDFQTYPVAGATSFTFFQEPIGQSSKTLVDTNMESAGQLPRPKEFLIDSIEVHLYPGEDPAQSGLSASPEFLNDMYQILSKGHLQIFVGSKPYLDLAPLIMAPSTVRLDASAAALSDSTTAAADKLTGINYAAPCGKPFILAPSKILLPSNQNFNVTIDFKTAVPLAGGTAGRIGVIMRGTQYRLSQ